MSLRMKRSLLAVIIFSIMISIFIFSSQDATVSSKVSGGVIEKTVSIVVKDFKQLPEKDRVDLVASLQHIARKMAHFSIYMVLGLLVMALMSTFRLDRRVQIIYTVIFCVVYAISDEMHQSFVPGRSCELRDVCIDGMGALTGALICYGLIIVHKIVKGSYKHI